METWYKSGSVSILVAHKNYMFIHQVALAMRQQKDLLVLGVKLESKDEIFCLQIVSNEQRTK